ncbi:DUF4870 domain-containing protein [Candidatus Micrarchaeota archaeon]|nr:DUF4870 domain-containing protein [Candidatus Micrarchaeota archaeon]
MAENTTQQTKVSGSAPAQSPSQLPGDNKLWAAAVYIIGILAPLAVLATDKKNDDFLRFHAYQALISQVALWGIAVVLTWFVIGLICFPIIFLAMLYFGYRAYMGEKFLLPVVGEMAEKYAKNQ